MQHPFLYKQSIIRDFLFLGVNSEATKVHNKKITCSLAFIFFPSIKAFQGGKTETSLHFFFNFRYCTHQEFSRSLSVPRENKISIGSFKAFYLSIPCNHKIFCTYFQKLCHMQSTLCNQTWELNKQLNAILERDSFGYNFTQLLVSTCIKPWGKFLSQSNAIIFSLAAAALMLDSSCPWTWQGSIPGDTSQ